VTGSVHQLNVSNGGVPKYAIPHTEATPLGLAGDRQAHPEFHGGPRQALLLISRENLDALREDGWPLFPGALGENVTTEGIDFRQVRIGQRYRIGEAIVEITKVRQPCHQLDPYGQGIQRAIFDRAAKNNDPRSAHWGLSGFYAAVPRPGLIRTGDIIQLLDQVV
jgi:MOSC domain-containing protein YiiM